MRFLGLFLVVSFLCSAVFCYVPSLDYSTKFTVESMKRWRESDRSIDTDSIDTNINKKIIKWQPGANQLTIQRPEGVRTYYAYVPSGYTGSTPVALHISMHGLGDTCENYGPAVGFSTLADQTGSFIYVYPCGYPGLLGNAWNAGTCCLSTYSIDDVQLMKDIVTEMKATFNINPNKIFASGFSNGAMMAERLACEAGDVFRAVASVSGVVELEPGNEGGLEACDTSFSKINKHVSVLGIHGDGDFTVPWTGDALLGFPPIPENFNRWAMRNDCSSNSTIQTFNKGTFSNQIYEGCAGDLHIEIVKNEGGGHEWPQTTDFDSTQYIYQYFNKFD